MLSDSAWLGSWCQTKLLIQKLLGNDSFLLDNISENPQQLQVLDNIRDSHARLHTLAESLHMETVPGLNRLQALDKKAQRALTDIVYRDLDRQILGHAADEDTSHDTARIVSLKGYAASAWLTAIPKIPYFKMEPAEF